MVGALCVWYVLLPPAGDWRQDRYNFGMLLARYESLAWPTSERSTYAAI